MNVWDYRLGNSSVIDNDDKIEVEPLSNAGLSSKKIQGVEVKDLESFGSILFIEISKGNK